MILQGLKNFFVNLKYYFTPLGALAVGVVFGLAVLFPAITGAVAMLADNVSEVTGSVQLDFRALADAIAEAVGALDWTAPDAALSTALSEEWLTTTLNACIHALVPGADAYAEQISEAVAVAIAQIIGGVIIFIALSALGLAGGFVLTRFFVRRTMAKRSLGGAFLSALFDFAVTVIFAVIFVWLGSLWQPSIYISAVALTLLYSALALLKGYVIFARGRVKLQEIVNPKTIALLMLTNFLVFLTAFVMMAAAVGIAGQTVGVFLSIPLFFISVTVITLNAESWARSAAENGKDTTKNVAPQTE